MSQITDPLTALNLALIAAFALGLLLTSGRRRLAAQATAANANRRS
ncbi:MAG: hypothetical protein P8R42_23560 [Candidatus Binatia bacterium]|nr:hypothetical protein [Candidatus Binatia bacterium]